MTYQQPEKCKHVGKPGAEFKEDYKLINWSHKISEKTDCLSETDYL